MTNEVRVTSATGGQKGKKPEAFGGGDPLSYIELAKVYAMGEAKYDRYNYLKGYAWSLSVDALFRHLFAFLSGEDRDPESGLLHTSHVAWHAQALTSFQLRGVGTDDRAPTMPPAPPPMPPPPNPPYGASKTSLSPIYDPAAVGAVYTIRAPRGEQYAAPTYATSIGTDRPQPLSVTREAHDRPPAPPPHVCTPLGEPCPPPDRPPWWSVTPSEIAATILRPTYINPVYAETAAARTAAALIRPPSGP